MVLEKIGAAPGSGYGAFPGQTFNPATGQVITKPITSNSFVCERTASRQKYSLKPSFNFKDKCIYQLATFWEGFLKWTICSVDNENLMNRHFKIKI